MSELLLCPFCGGEARTGFIRDGAQVSCPACHASVVAFSPNAQASAIAAWNRRATPAEVDALRAERDAAEALGRQWCHDAQVAQEEVATLRARVETLEAALRRIADDSQVIEENSNSEYWPETVARAALGDTP